MMSLIGKRARGGRWPNVSEWQANLASVFFFLSALVIIYGAVQILWMPFRFAADSGDSPSRSIPSFHVVQLDPLSAYQKDFATHALFSKPKAPVESRGPGFAELLRPYELIGIVQDNGPEALIQNRSMNQTHFVRLGEEFDRFRLVQIRSHSVVLEYEGEEREIHLEGGVR